MAKKTQPAQTAAPPPAPTREAPPPPVSNAFGVKRVANGFLVEIGFSYGDGFRSTDREQRVARTPAELGAIVAEWATPTPKKR